MNGGLMKNICKLILIVLVLAISQNAKAGIEDCELELTDGNSSDPCLVSKPDNNDTCPIREVTPDLPTEVCKCSFEYVLDKVKDDKSYCKVYKGDSSRQLIMFWRQFKSAAVGVGGGYDLTLKVPRAIRGNVDVLGSSVGIKTGDSYGSNDEGTLSGNVWDEFYGLMAKELLEWSLLDDDTLCAKTGPGQTCPLGASPGELPIESDDFHFYLGTFPIINLKLKSGYSTDCTNRACSGNAFYFIHGGTWRSVAVKAPPITDGFESVPPVFSSSNLLRVFIKANYLRPLVAGGTFDGLFIKLENSNDEWSNRGHGPLISGSFRVIDFYSGLRENAMESRMIAFNIPEKAGKRLHSLYESIPRSNILCAGIEKPRYFKNHEGKCELTFDPAADVRCTKLLKLKYATVDSSEYHRIDRSADLTQIFDCDTSEYLYMLEDGRVLEKLTLDADMMNASTPITCNIPYYKKSYTTIKALCSGEYPEGEMLIFENEGGELTPSYLAEFKKIEGLDDTEKSYVVFTNPADEAELKNDGDSGFSQNYYVFADGQVYRIEFEQGKASADPKQDLYVDIMGWPQKIINNNYPESDPDPNFDPMAFIFYDLDLKYLGYNEFAVDSFLADEKTQVLSDKFNRVVSFYGDKAAVKLADREPGEYETKYDVLNVGYYEGGKVKLFEQCPAGRNDGGGREVIKCHIDHKDLTFLAEFKNPSDECGRKNKEICKGEVCKSERDYRKEDVMCENGLVCNDSVYDNGEIQVKFTTPHMQDGECEVKCNFGFYKQLNEKGHYDCYKCDGIVSGGGESCIPYSDDTDVGDGADSCPQNISLDIGTTCECPDDDMSKHEVGDQFQCVFSMS